MRTGTLTIQQLGFSTPKEPDFITSLGGLRGLKYVKGALTIQENYHLDNLGGIGPIVVPFPLATTSTLQRAPLGAACCPAPCNGQDSTYLCCATTCGPLKELNNPGGFQEDNVPCSDLRCEDNPYCTAPTPSPVAGPTSPACTITELSGGSVTVDAGDTLCLTAPGNWNGGISVAGNLVVCGQGDFIFSGSGVVSGGYYRTSTTEVKTLGGGSSIFVNGGTTSIADSNC